MNIYAGAGVGSACVDAATMCPFESRLLPPPRATFEKPISMPAGTTIEIVADMEDSDRLSSQAFGGFAAQTSARPFDIRLSLDVVSRQASPLIR